MKHIVIAGNARQAEDYRRAQGLDRRDVIYVVSAHRLNGLLIEADDVVARIGTFYERRDLREIDAVITRARAKAAS